MAEVKYAILGSGSAANAYLFQYENFCFAIDNGFSKQEFIKRAAIAGFKSEQINFILLTHTHSDHLKGVAPLSQHLHCPVYHHKKIRNEYGFYKPMPLTPNQKITLGAMELIPFNTSHDAEHSLGYSFRLGGRTFTLITDTGDLDRQMGRLAYHSDILFLEANYSQELLAEGSYPYFLKRRIMSRKGHLSNRMSAEFLEYLTKDSRSRLQMIYLLHLSENNNTPEKVAEELKQYYSGSIDVRICGKSELVSSRIDATAAISA